MCVVVVGAGGGVGWGGGWGGRGIKLNCYTDALTWKLWLMFLVLHSATLRLDRSISLNSTD